MLCVYQLFVCKLMMTLFHQQASANVSECDYYVCMYPGGINDDDSLLISNIWTLYEGKRAREHHGAGNRWQLVATHVNDVYANDWSRMI